MGNELTDLLFTLDLARKELSHAHPIHRERLDEIERLIRRAMREEGDIRVRSRREDEGFDWWLAERGK